MSGKDEWIKNLAKDPKKLESLLNNLSALSVQPEKEKEHKFWNTQPVPKGEKTEEGPIEAPKKADDIKQNGLPLPPDYEWVELEACGKPLEEIYELLSENYVEDVESMFRFDYPDKFLDWALKPPGWRKEWNIGVRSKSSKKLMAFVSAIPISVRVRDKTVNSVEVNFLCVHKALRAKRLTPVLIKEITRRVNLKGIFQAMYTAGIFIPTPLSSARYYHRTLNPRKLIETGFSQLPQNSTMNKTIKNFALPKSIATKGLREFQKEDISAVKNIYDKYMSQFEWTIEFTEEELLHWLLPVENVIYTYVVENDNVISDFISFYILPSSVIGNDKHKQIKAAYSFYYGVSDAKNLTPLMNDALILANNMNCDVFNCLEILNNHIFLEELKFGKGDGTLQFYMFNWNTDPIDNHKVGIIML